MMRTIRFLTIALLSTAAIWAQAPSAKAPRAKASSAKTVSAKAVSAKTSSKAGAPAENTHFTADSLDKSVLPCNDFYAYACSKWKDQNPTLPERASRGRFNELGDRGEAIVHEILEKAAAETGRTSGYTIEQKIGDYYGSCIDEAAIEAKGLKPLQADLASIAAVKSAADLPLAIARLHREGVNVLFAPGAGPDFKDSNQVIAEVGPGGMALPDRDYYLRKEQDSEDLRQQYAAHVQKMFQLLGDSRGQAAAEASSVLAIETSLANGALNLVKRRTPDNIYHKMTVPELAALSPKFDWVKYFAAIQAPVFQNLNVSEPDFIKNVNEMLQSVSVEDWRSYLRWQTVHANAAVLPKRFADENFEFFNKKLQGAKEPLPRWKRCARVTNGDLGDAVGQKYVELTFGTQGKERALKMVRVIEAALREDIVALPWMTEVTKNHALEKLSAITNRVGYPDKWRDYSSFLVVRGDAFGNSQRASVFEFTREMAKAGQPVDKTEWPYPPTAVNATYNPLQNNITFPAGILQPPFFDSRGDDAMNFGAIGGVISHELTHGFDNQGRQFDIDGSLKDWWKPTDAEEFKKRAKCFVDEYSAFTVVGDQKLDGKLTLEENMADNGGLRIAYTALLSILAGKEPAPIDGLTAKQRFFVGWADAWCQNRTNAVSRLAAQTDPHAPGKYRVNGTVSNMPEFQEAFHCKADAPMVRKDVCRVW